MSLTLYFSSTFITNHLLSNNTKNFFRQSVGFWLTVLFSNVTFRLCRYSINQQLFQIIKTKIVLTHKPSFSKAYPHNLKKLNWCQHNHISRGYHQYKLSLDHYKIHHHNETLYSQQEKFIWKNSKTINQLSLKLMKHNYAILYKTKILKCSITELWLNLTIHFAIYI